MTRVLVTGALGNVGREVVRACSDRALVVRVAHRDEVAAQTACPTAEVARFDFVDRTSWPAALAGCEHVFLLRPPPIADMNATLNPFIDAAYAAGVQHIVFLSVARADQMKWVPHRKVELHLMASNGSWTILRPGFFAQNLVDAYLRDIREDDRLYVPAGRGRVAFFDVRDAGDVAARMFAEPTRYRGAALTLTGPEALTFEDVAALLSDVLGRAIRYEPASIVGYMLHLRRRGMPAMQIVIQTILHVGLRRGDAETVESTVREILGREPSGLRAYIERVANKLSR